jgi:hypothetical protein
MFPSFQNNSFLFLCIAIFYLEVFKNPCVIKVSKNASSRIYLSPVSGNISWLQENNSCSVNLVAETDFDGAL